MRTTIPFLVLTCFLIVASYSNAQRDAYHEFAMEIDHESNQTESYNAILIDTFGYEVETFYLSDGEYHRSNWNRYPYQEFKIYSDGESTHKLYISEKDSLRLTYSQDSIYVKFWGYSVRNRLKYYTSLLENGTITRKTYKPYDRDSARCLDLYIMNTNFLLKGKLNSLRIAYDGVSTKELELKAHGLDLSRASWSFYNVFPDELDTVEVFVTHKNGDTLYSEFFTVIDKHDETFKDFKDPSRNCCDKIITYDNFKIVRSKNQRIVVRSKNYDTTKFQFDIENGKLISNINNVLEIEWGEGTLGAISIRYGDTSQIRQTFIIQD